jgi:hypothetical protein
VDLFCLLNKLHKADFGGGRELLIGKKWPEKNIAIRNMKINPIQRLPRFEILNPNK